MIACAESELLTYIFEQFRRQFKTVENLAKLRGIAIVEIDYLWAQHNKELFALCDVLLVREKLAYHRNSIQAWHTAIQVRVSRYWMLLMILSPLWVVVEPERPGTTEPILISPSILFTTVSDGRANN